jgi:pimeloyl-ACP methyl ester carboxylesterase
VEFLFDLHGAEIPRTPGLTAWTPPFPTRCFTIAVHPLTQQEGPMPATRDIRLGDDRVLRAHDSGGSGALTILWHHGSPQTGTLLPPLLEAATRRGIRLVSYARPSYGGSTPRPGRDVASAAHDVASIADALGIERFAVMGASGGGPHALACAALLPDRVVGSVCLATPAPFQAGIDWFAGMTGGGPSLRAAEAGRDARTEYERTAEFDPESFTERDWDALNGPWTSLGDDAGASIEAGGAAGVIDDDLAFVGPWGFDPSAIAAPVLLVHGGMDRIIPVSHSRWLVEQLPWAELWYRPRDGHISILDAVPLAMDWLLGHVRHGQHPTSTGPPD